jgi:hypothetical protein
MGGEGARLRLEARGVRAAFAGGSAERIALEFGEPAWRRASAKLKGALLPPLREKVAAEGRRMQGGSRVSAMAWNVQHAKSAC